jgi:hypothetical protein
MACFRCGRPPWQHWTDYQNRVACFYPFKTTAVCLLPYLWTTPANKNVFGSTQSIHHYRCPPQVKRRRLKDTRNHTRDDVLMNYGHSYSNLSAGAIKDICSSLDKERQEIRTWATNEIKKRMLETARVCGMVFGRDKTTVLQFNDIYTSWTEDSSDANARKMYQVLYGDYEGKNAHWSKILERKFMETFDRQYIVENDEAENSKIGCYEKQITGSKTTQVKLLNRADAKEKRGKSIQMSKPGPDARMSNQGRRNENASTRRKTGDFYVKNLVTVSCGRVVREI